MQAMFRQAAQLAERGDYPDSIDTYERLAGVLRAAGSPVPSPELTQLLRSVCFNLAQVLNKRGKFQKALACADEGLRFLPTDVGRAIALSARGEALYGLGQPEEAIVAFREAVLAHPIIGRLNSADSMTRLGSDQLIALAEQWVEHVVNSFGSELKAQWWSEVDTIRGRIAAQRGDYATARVQFEAALRADPNCTDAKFQLRLLPVR